MAFFVLREHPDGGNQMERYNTRSILVTLSHVSLSSIELIHPLCGLTGVVFFLSSGSTLMEVGTKLGGSGDFTLYGIG